MNLYDKIIIFQKNKKERKKERRKNAYKFTFWEALDNPYNGS